MSGEYTLNVRRTAARPRSKRLRMYGIGDAGAVARVRREGERRERGAYRNDIWNNVRIDEGFRESATLRKDLTGLQDATAVTIVSIVEFYHEGTRDPEETAPEMPTAEDSNGWLTEPAGWEVCWMFRVTTLRNGTEMRGKPRRMVLTADGIYKDIEDVKTTLTEMGKGIDGLSLKLDGKITKDELDNAVGTAVRRVVSWYHEATGAADESEPLPRTGNDDKGWTQDPGQWGIYWTYQEVHRMNNSIVKTRVHRVVRSLTGVETELETFRTNLAEADRKAKETLGKVKVNEDYIKTLQVENERLTVEAAPRLEQVMTMAADRFAALAYFDPEIADPRVRWSFMLCIVTGCHLTRGGTAQSVPCVLAKACGPSGSGSGISGGAWSCWSTLYRLKAGTRYTVNRAIQLYYIPEGGGYHAGAFPVLADGVRMLFPKDLLETSEHVNELTDTGRATAASYSYSRNVFTTRDGKTVSFDSDGTITVTETEAAAVSEEEEGGDV